MGASEGSLAPGRAAGESRLRVLGDWPARPARTPPQEVAEAEEDIRKAEGGNKAAGTRVRKKMQEIKAAATDVRKKILESRDTEPEAGAA